MSSGETVVMWARDVDLANVHDKKIEIDQLLDGADVESLVIDLRELDFIDSLGLGVLIHARDRCAGAEVPLILRRVPDRTLRLLSSAGLDRLFTIEP